MLECTRTGTREEERFDCIVKKRKRDKSNVYNIEMGGLNNITPCAACKLLRRRCAEECPFSPYFSPHEPHKFAAVHKVFGASNVSKLLLEVGESQRADAANSLVYEANLRLRDPVYGCLGAISALEQQIQYLQSQLIAARSQIIKFKLYTDQASIINIDSTNKNVTFSTTATITTSISTCNNAASLLVALPPDQSPSSHPVLPGPATPPPVLPNCVAAVSSSSNSSSVSSSLYTPPTATSNGYNTTTINSSVDFPYFNELN